MSEPERTPPDSILRPETEGRRTAAGAGDTATLAAVANWTHFGTHEHCVQFYENEAFLLSSAGGYIGAGLLTGAANIVIATASHREALERQWEARGLDLAAARAEGRYVALDAAETLARFMHQGWPQERLFNDVVGTVFAAASARHSRVRAFGEIVALLWAEGNQTAALRLEELWNKLAGSHSFSLFCAYPMHGFADRVHHKRFMHICRTHARVIPAESYTALVRPEDRLRAITELQQKAAALDAILHERGGPAEASDPV